jgi:hypothetical protein
VQALAEKREARGLVYALQDLHHQPG